MHIVGKPPGYMSWREMKRIEREREREREAFLCSSVSFLLSFAEQGRSIEGGGPLAAAAADRGVNGEYPMS